MIYVKSADICVPRSTVLPSVLFFLLYVGRYNLGSQLHILNWLLLFAAREYKLEEIAPPQNFASLAKFIKRVCDTVFNLQRQKFLPGKHERDQSHSCGRAIPRGAIFGARPFFSRAELQGFAKLIMEGGGRTLKTWQFDLDLCRV